MTGHRGKDHADHTDQQSSNETGTGCMATAISTGYRALFNDHVARDARSLADLAATVGVSARQLARILSGETPLRLEAIVALGDLLGIDRQRALMAIGVLGDWQRYADPNLAVILQLVQPVMGKLDAQAEFAIEPLTLPAVDRFADWLADAIIANEEQIRSRRDAFTDLPELRRSNRHISGKPV